MVAPHLASYPADGIKVLLAMRWELVRRGIADMLKDVSRSGLGVTVDLVGEAGTLDEVFTMARDFKPEAVICRTNLLGLGIQTFTTRLQEAAGGPVPLVILSRSMNPARIVEACSYEVAAYLPAEVNAITLATALLSVRSGNVVLCKEARAALFEKTQHRSPGTWASAEVLDTLTGRERDVIRLVAEGLSNKEIAFRLGIGRRTAEMHVARLIDKFHMASRSELLVALLTR